MKYGNVQTNCLTTNTQYIFNGKQQQQRTTDGDTIRQQAKTRA